MLFVVLLIIAFWVSIILFASFQYIELAVWIGAATFLLSIFMLTVSKFELLQDRTPNDDILYDAMEYQNFQEDPYESPLVIMLCRSTIDNDFIL
jgi:hypothetical protein